MRILANTDRPYLYIFKHGIGPGTIPNDVSIVKVKDLPNYYTAVWLDRFLTTSELKKYDIPSETEINKYLNWIGYCQKDGDVVPCNEVEACGNITASKKIVASKMSDIDLLMHEALECTTKDELSSVISGLDSLGLRKLYLHYMEMLRDDSLSVGYIASDLSDTLYNMFSGKVNACGNVMASHMWDDENFDWEDYGDPDSFGGFASPEDFENWYQNLGSHDSGKDVKASRTINKWNRETEQYDPVEIPDDWNVKMYSDNMDEIINCPNCGKELPYGKGYTSRRYHNKYGMGYMECEDCYYDQLKEERGGNDVNACGNVMASSTFDDEGVFDVVYGRGTDSDGEFSEVYRRTANSLKTASKLVYEGLGDGFDVFVSSWDYDIEDGDIFFDHEYYKFIDIPEIEKTIISNIK